MGNRQLLKAIRDRISKLNQKGIGTASFWWDFLDTESRSWFGMTKARSIVMHPVGKSTKVVFCPFDTGVQLVTDEKGNSRSDGNGKALSEPVPNSLIKLSEIMRQLSVAKAGNRVVIADCCRTIPNQARGRSFGASFQITDLPTNTSVLFGCSTGEEALESPKWGHGAFTKCLLDEIPRLSQQVMVDTGSLAAHLKKKVPVLVASLSPNNKQNPRAFITDIVDLQLKYESSGFEGSKAGDRKELNGIAFRWCPAGKFTMGSPKSETGHEDDEDQVSVTLTKGFWLGETEITQSQWQKLDGNQSLKVRNTLRKVMIMQRAISVMMMRWSIPRN